MTLVLLRHGSTDLNTAGRIRGQLDVPMTPEGEREVATTAKQFAGLPIKRIIASTRQRSIKSAQILAQHIGGNPEIVPTAAMDPWNLGQLQGQSQHSDRKALAQLYADPDKPAPGGESYNQFLGRFLPAVLPLIHDKEPHLMVSHNRNMHALEALAAGGGKSIDTSVLAGRDEGHTKPGQVMVLGPDYKPRFLGAEGDSPKAPQ